jgi:hypothetical protein
MRINVLTALALLASTLVFSADSSAHCPYAGEENREIKALAMDFIKGLKAGALRAEHLGAHIQATALLNPQQILV